MTVRKFEAPKNIYKFEGSPQREQPIQFDCMAAFDHRAPPTRKSSIKRSVAPKLEAFSQSTTFHGFSELMAGKSNALRGLWLLFMAIAYGYCIFLVVRTAQLYVTAPVVTEMTFEPLASIPRVYFAPANPLDDEKLRRDNVTKEMQDYLEMLIDTRSYLVVSKKANELSVEISDDLGSYDGKAYVDKMTEGLQDVFTDLVNSKGHYPSQNQKDFVNPSNFREVVHKYTLDPEQIGSGTSLGFKTDVEKKIEADGVWYELDFKRGEGKSKPTVGDELYIFNHPLIDSNDRTYSRLRVEGSDEVHDVVHRFTNKFIIEVTVEHKIRNCTDNEHLEVLKVEVCRNKIAEATLQCCLCNQKFVACKPAIKRCCCAHDFMILSQNTAFQTCGQNRTTPCKRSLFDVATMQIPLDDGTTPGNVAGQLLEASLLLQFANTERSLAFYEKPRFEFTSALSSVGGFLGLLVGGSCLSVLHVFYFCLDLAVSGKYEK